MHERRPRVGEDPVTIRLEGVEYMNDDPSKVDVLYAKVHDESGRYRNSFFVACIIDLLSFCNYENEESLHEMEPCSI